MKKGSSRNRRKAPPRREAQPRREARPPSRYPVRDNVYSFEQERQRKQRQVQTRKSQGYPPPAATAKKQKKQRKKRKRAYMVMPLLIFAMIALYLCGQIFLLASKKSEINVETVEYGSTTAPQLHTGLIVRDEYVGTSTRSGQPFYQYSQGDYVMKGAAVCTVKDTDSTDVLEGKLDAIDLDILKSQKARTDLSVFSEDIARLEDNITRTVDTYAGRSMKSNVSYMYTMKSQVSSFMDQRNEIWLTENVDSLSQLTQERSSYQQQLAKSMSSINTQESGILCLSYDGLEETLTPDTLESITEAQIGGTDTEYISKAKTVAEGDPLFKIVSSNKWYIVAFLPVQDTLGWEKGDTRSLDIVTEEETLRVSALVETIEQGEEKTKVVFSSYEYMESFMERRTVSFSLKNKAVEGLKIPNDAIVEKSLLRIPLNCIVEGGVSKGVMLANGEKGRFLEVTVVASDEENAYVEQNNGTLKTGDVILIGEGENAERYTVSDLALQTGVYVANSSMARFVVVEIVEQNQEYAIVKAGQSTGLQPYDTIVSDAKNVTEGQSIY